MRNWQKGFLWLWLLWFLHALFNIKNLQFKWGSTQKANKMKRITVCFNAHEVQDNLFLFVDLSMDLVQLDEFSTFGRPIFDWEFKVELTFFLSPSAQHSWSLWVEFYSWFLFFPKFIFGFQFLYVLILYHILFLEEELFFH